MLNDGEPHMHYLCGSEELLLCFAVLECLFCLCFMCAASECFQNERQNRSRKMGLSEICFVLFECLMCKLDGREHEAAGK